jgi:hypothetical protein
MVEDQGNDSCPFSEALYLFQVDPDLPTDDEWKGLREHLVASPPCPACFREMFRNYDFLKAREAYFAKLRQQ